MSRWVFAGVLLSVALVWLYPLILRAGKQMADYNKQVHEDLNIEETEDDSTEST